VVRAVQVLRAAAAALPVLPRQLALRAVVVRLPNLAPVDKEKSARSQGEPSSGSPNRSRVRC
jgi:hypothetical protein